MFNIAEYNDGVRYLLFVIDILSRKLWVEPLKNKTAKSVIEGMKTIFKDAKPKKIRADRGAEFLNKWFLDYMATLEIYFFTTQNPTKANYMFNELSKRHSTDI